MKKTIYTALLFSFVLILADSSTAQKPTLAGRPCPLPDPTFTDVNVKVTNSTNTVVDVKFVNYQNCADADTMYTIKPGQTVTVESRVGEPWRFREAGTGKLLKETIMAANVPQINITGAAAAPPPSNLPPPKDEVIYVFKNKANVTNCTPNPGWAKCIQLAEPTIRIMATKAVSQSAMNGVANVYTEMMGRLGSKYPKNKLDTFIVHMTNAEPWPELINLAPIGMAFPQQPYQSSGDFIRGYGNPDNLWITEQMICKTGVKTRNDKQPGSDNTVRTLDQVVHEFGHSLHSNYLTDQIVNSTFKFPNGPQWLTPLESFPYRLQQWFRTPNIDHVAISPKEDSFLKGFFTARATFSCDGYKP